MSVDVATWERLAQAAIKVRENAYAPFSNYRVGAALLTQSGHIHAGCNVENSTYGATLCAERAAICAMVARGERDLVAVVVASAPPEPATPCGICRQVLAEFALDLPVVAISVEDGKVLTRRDYALAHLLPHAFRLRSAAG